jgi:hypothetical protein
VAGHQRNKEEETDININRKAIKQQKAAEIQFYLQTLKF